MAAKNPGRSSPKSATPKSTLPKSILNFMAGLPKNLRISKVVQHSESVEIFVDLPSPPRVCPICRQNDCTIKDGGREQSVRHITIAGTGSFVTFHRSRFFCKHCHISFMQDIDWIHPSFHITMKLFHEICLSLGHMLSVTMIASIHHVTPSTVDSILDSVDIPRPVHLPMALGIDEFMGSSGIWNEELHQWSISKFHCNISNADAGYVSDVLMLASVADVKKYFRQYPIFERERVQCFCCDMHNGFISVAKELFPSAHVCIDTFHLINNLNKFVTAVRLRLQREAQDCGDMQKYRMLKHAAKSILMNEWKQTVARNPKNASRRSHLNILFSTFPEIKLASDALQSFHLILAQPELTLRRAMLTDWLETYLSCGLPEIEAAARSIRHWRGYIDNTWAYGRTNSTCEGLNKKIKDIKRIAFGTHNFERFRKRILLVCGPARPASSFFTLFGQKKEEAKKKS